MVHGHITYQTKIREYSHYQYICGNNKSLSSF